MPRHGDCRISRVTTSPEHDRSPEVSASAKAGAGVTVPVIEEAVDLQTHSVERSTVRITKKVATRDERVETLLQEERVEVERRPIGKTISNSSLLPVPRYEGDTLVIPVLEEILVTDKRTVLVEEVRVTRVQEARRESLQVPLRKEEVHVDRLDAAATDRDALSSADPPGDTTGTTPAELPRGEASTVPRDRQETS